jgi:hypothetical protein
MDVKASGACENCGCEPNKRVKLTSARCDKGRTFAAWAQHSTANYEFPWRKENSMVLRGRARETL